MLLVAPRARLLLLFASLLAFVIALRRRWCSPRLVLVADDQPDERRESMTVHSGDSHGATAASKETADALNRVRPAAASTRRLSYNSTPFAQEHARPPVIVSYASAADSGRGEQHMCASVLLAVGCVPGDVSFKLQHRRLPEGPVARWSLNTRPQARGQFSQHFHTQVVRGSHTTGNPAAC